MHTIYAESNWRLRWTRNAEGVTILRAQSCDESAVLPETIADLPVTALADYALSPTAAPCTAGETLQICGSAAPGEWDNRRLHTLRLPRSLREVGNYAFYNCRALREIALFDGVKSWGNGVLMNCRALHRLHLTRLHEAQGESLAYFAAELSGELDVTLHEPDGTARLVFPAFVEDYEENCPAHHFDYSISGAGHPYHHVFRGKALQYADFDALWQRFLATEHEEQTALCLSWRRLRQPYQLTTAAAELYRSYLRSHAAAAFALVLREGDMEGLRLLLSDFAEDAAALEAALALARDLRRTEATALLLERQHRLGADRRAKRFEL